ncbi:uncharacterized protein LOC122014078 [Zingiber officinale]|uniref:uncharacterized protein LOC122014078 n=1 Tax=Zingiber officinale TaxID=94328 RepID=UPI001C4CC335|nr:uncharacterized protein LOC122014078 [Zingiber officinale]
MESGTSKSKVKRHVGKYELGRTIGEGTFAKVRFAKNIETGEPVAINILDKEKVLNNDNTKYKVIALSVFSDCIITPLTNERSVCLSCQNPFRYEDTRHAFHVERMVSLFQEMDVAIGSIIQHRPSPKNVLIMQNSQLRMKRLSDKPQGVHNVQDKSCHSPLSKKVSLVGDEPSEVHNGQDKPSHSCLSKKVSLARDELAGVHNAQDKPSHSLLSKLAGDKPSHSLLSETVPGDKPSHSCLTMQAHLHPFITCRLLYRHPEHRKSILPFASICSMSPRRQITPPPSPPLNANEQVLAGLAHLLRQNVSTSQVARTEMSYEKFRKMGPSKFTGSTDPFIADG